MMNKEQFLKTCDKMIRINQQIDFLMADLNLMNNKLEQVMEVQKLNSDDLMLYYDATQYIDLDKEED